VISGAPKRTFVDALKLAGLATPRNRQELGLRFFELLVLGIDHEFTGEMCWYQAVENTAPKDPTRRRVQ